MKRKINSLVAIVFLVGSLLLESCSCGCPCCDNKTEKDEITDIGSNGLVERSVGGGSLASVSRSELELEIEPGTTVKTSNSMATIKFGVKAVSYVGKDPDGTLINTTITTREPSRKDVLFTQEEGYSITEVKTGKKGTINLPGVGIVKTDGTAFRIIVTSSGASIAIHKGQVKLKPALSDLGETTIIAGYMQPFDLGGRPIGTPQPADFSGLELQIFQDLEEILPSPGTATIRKTVITTTTQTLTLPITTTTITVTPTTTITTTVTETIKP